MHPPASVRVLSVGDHESIRSSREMLLQSAGYSVVSVSSHGALTMEIPRDLAIAIIGQTVDDRTALRIAAQVHRAQANTRIVRLTIQYQRSGPEFDACCFVEDGPEAFLSGIAELFPPLKFPNARQTCLPAIGCLSVGNPYAMERDQDAARASKWYGV